MGSQQGREFVDAMKTISTCFKNKFNDSFPTNIKVYEIHFQKSHTFHYV